MKIILAIFTGISLFAQTATGPVTSGTWGKNARDQINKNMVTKDASGNVAVPGTFSVGTAVSVDPTRSPVNPVAKGADPTGAADSTTAFQAAVTAACASDYGHIVEAPPNSLWKISSSITLPCGRFELRGNKSYINYIGTGDLFHVTASSSDVLIAGWDMNGPGTAGTIAIHVTSGPAKMKIRDNLFAGWGTAAGGAAIRFDTADTQGAEVRSNIFVQTAGDAIQIDTATDNFIATDNQFSISAGGRCWYVDNNSGTSAVLFSHNNCVGSKTVMYLGTTGYLTIRDNEFEVTACAGSTGVIDANGGTGSTIRMLNNTINANSQCNYGVLVGNAQSGSFFKDNRVWGYSTAGFSVGSGPNVYDNNISVVPNSLYSSFPDNSVFIMNVAGKTGVGKYAISAKFEVASDGVSDYAQLRITNTHAGGMSWDIAEQYCAGCLSYRLIDGVNNPELMRLTSALQTYNVPLTVPPGGSVSAWKVYRVAAIADAAVATLGTGTCANANGCWDVTGRAVLAKTAASAQDIPLFQLPTRGLVEGMVAKSTTACSGATTAKITDFGTTGTPGYYKTSMTYDLLAAVVATNILRPVLTGFGSDTTAATNVTARITTTVENVDQVAAGCAFEVLVKWSVSP